MDREQELVALCEQYEAALASRRLDEAESIANQVFALALSESAKEFENNPSPELLIESVIAECEGNGDWKGAEAGYRELIRIAEDDVGRMRWNCELGRFLWLMGRLTEALQHSEVGISAARRCGVRPFLADYLQGHAVLLQKQDRPDAARLAVNEAIGIVQEYSRLDQSLARLLVVRAELEVAAARLDAADADLAQSWAILAPSEAMHFAAGCQRNLGSWWAATARRRAAVGQVTEAIAAWREAVERGRHVAAAPQCAGIYTQHFLTRMLNGLSESLSTAGLFDEAKAVGAERAAILAAMKLPRELW